jgi:hypothetical protein
MMNKTARAQIVNHFYNLGMQSAMSKTAGSATEVLKALANPSKRALRAIAPYAGVGGGALVGKNIAASAAADVQKAISRAHLPDIQKAFTEGLRLNSRGEPLHYSHNINRLLDSTKDITIPGKSLFGDTPEAILSRIGTTDKLTGAGRGNVLEAITKSINQQELAEMGLLGAGIAGGGALGHAALKDLRRHIR